MSGRQFLSENNVMAELSYAYLHAIASHAHFGCAPTDRNNDAIAIDAFISVRERLSRQSRWTDFKIEVQLKATTRVPEGQHPFFSFPMPVHQYDKLRDTRALANKLLVILLLPEQTGEWLKWTMDELLLRRCAYWVSLRGAPAVSSVSTTNVRISRANVLSVDRLRELATRISCEDYIYYDDVPRTA
jgi:hypothetical protein